MRYSNWFGADGLARTRANPTGEKAHRNITEPKMRNDKQEIIDFCLACKKKVCNGNCQKLEDFQRGLVVDKSRKE